MQRSSAAEEFKPNGRTRLIGSFADESNRVLFRAHEGAPSPILILECYLGEIKCFGIQLVNYLEFHHLKIKMSSKGLSTVLLKWQEASAEQHISTEALVCSYTPIPYLAKIATHFR